MDETPNDETKDEGNDSLADRLNAGVAELFRNGEPINWSYWANVAPTIRQAARLAYAIDPIKWPGTEYAQGPVPDPLRQKIEQRNGWSKIGPSQQ